MGTAISRFILEPVARFFAAMLRSDSATRASALEQSASYSGEVDGEIDPLPPRYWCEVCQQDLQSAQTLRQHLSGRKHQAKAGLLSTVTHADLRSEFAGVDEFGCLREEQDDDNVDHLALPNDDVDLSRIQDTERMRQRAYDDAVVEVALFNYESFYNLQHGSATFAVVNATSAGIHGWAACILKEETSDGSLQSTSEPPVSTMSQRVGQSKRKGDQEEARQLQIALLESVGVRPPAILGEHVLEETYDDDSSDYSYGDECSVRSCENEYCHEEFLDDDEVDGNTDNVRNENRNSITGSGSHGQHQEGVEGDDEAEISSQTESELSDGVVIVSLNNESSIEYEDWNLV